MAQSSYGKVRRVDIGGGQHAAAQAAALLVNTEAAGALTPGWVDHAERTGLFPVMHRLLPDVGAARRQGDLTDLTAALRLLALDLRPVFTAGPAGAAARVNALLAPLRVQVAVSTHDAQRPHLHVDAQDSEPSVRVRVTCLVGLAGALSDPSGLHRLGACAAGGCGRVFVDTSRSARQRYCSRRCATRCHVSAHRSRSRLRSPAPAP